MYNSDELQYWDHKLWDTVGLLALQNLLSRQATEGCPSERMLPMTVDFEIRLSRYPDDPAEDTHAYYERTLNSLSEHITTVWLSEHLQKGDSPSFES